MDDLGLLYTDTAYANTPAERDTVRRVAARYVAFDADVLAQLGLDR